MNPPGKTRGATEAEGKSLSLTCLQTSPEENAAGTIIESGAGYSQGQRRGGREREREREGARQEFYLEGSRNSQPPQIATYTMVEQVGNSRLHWGFALLMEIQS